ncbi:hypothetical protein ABW20_dc0101948 [Dactylellina cionopaga]|nr:hypothetical protein ABW20_dc0101948 [Dactylellina cionopaga]
MGETAVFFAGVPPYKARSKLPPAVIDRCLALWAANLHALRQLPDKEFVHEATSNKTLTNFTQSYILNDDLFNNELDDWLYRLPSASGSSQELATKAKFIKHALWVCLKRAAKLGCAINNSLIPTAQGLIKLAALFFPEGRARSLLRAIWTQSDAAAATVRESIREHVKLLSTTVDELAKGKTTVGNQHVALLQELCYFIMALPEVSDEVLADETLFENLAAAYRTLLALSTRTKAPAATTAIATTLLEEMRRLPFTVIVAGMQTEQKRYSTVIDFLFNFTAGADSQLQQASYITAIVSETPLLERLNGIDAEGYTNRWSTILQKLKKFDTATASSSKKKVSRLPRRKLRTKKSSFGNSDGNTTAGSSSQTLSELKELFPNMEQSILQAILQSVNYDVEAATIALLDGSIPEAQPTATAQSTNTLPAPPSDELDNLTVPTSRLYMGKRGLGSTADDMLADRSGIPSKDKILAALQSFDSDDDERDDTYDQDDIGGAVDSSIVDSEANATAVNATTEGDEKLLYKALVEDPTVFARDAKTKRSVPRQKLRDATGMSDEAIEGWKIMLDRDGGKRLRQLEISFTREAVEKEQVAIPRTAYRKGEEGDEEEGEGQRQGGASRGHPRRHFGPNDRAVRGDQRDHAPVLSDGKEPYHGKKTSKARGEHSRKMQSAARDRQRSKKMAKGGL